MAWKRGTCGAAVTAAGGRVAVTARARRQRWCAPPHDRTGARPVIRRDRKAPCAPTPRRSWCRPPPARLNERRAPRATPAPSRARAGAATANPPFPLAKIVAPASNDSHARGAGGA